MKADRELLELAAKAAGLSVFDDPITGEMMETQIRDSDGAWRQVFWNPLLDDGDALRLMVKLGLVDHVICLSIGLGRAACEFLSEGFEGDPAAATRRAIVRAAAEIGKKLP